MSLGEQGQKASMLLSPTNWTDKWRILQAYIVDEHMDKNSIIPEAPLWDNVRSAAEGAGLVPKWPIAILQIYRTRR